MKAKDYKVSRQWTRRQVLARMGLGTASALALTACGGGGDSSSGDVQALRDAFAKLQPGMNHADVENLVGFPANDWKSNVNWRWIVGGVTLYVVFYSGEGPVYSAKLTEADGVTNQFRDLT